MTATKPRKAFRTTGLSGFHVSFPNGYTVSVQFGPHNYCEARQHPSPHYVSQGVAGLIAAEREAGENGSNTAETAVLKPDGGLMPYSREDGFNAPDNGVEEVQADMTAMDVLKLMMLTAELPKGR